MSFREAVEVVYYIACTQERVNEILIVVFHFMKCTATILTFSFTDPVEELLLTELDNAFTSRVSFRAVAELVYSVQSVSVASPHVGIL